MTECTDEKLEEFSRYHYTYINQFFGDKNVRQIIAETYPEQRKRYKFKIRDYGNTLHHFIKNKITDDEICSLNLGYQDLGKNKYDTLCQSYSLLTFFDIPINTTDRVQLQKDMIKMYRNILDDKKFMNRLTGNRGLEKIPAIKWSDYTNTKKPFDESMTGDEYLQNVRRVLDDWESFGFYYFIGKGKCPSKPRSPSKPRTKRALDESEIRNTVNPANIREGRTRKSAKTIMATDATMNEDVETTGGRRRSTRKNTKSSNK